MPDHIIIGQYVEGHSILHRLDPRTKIVSVFALMLSMLLLDSLFGYALATLVVGGLMVLSNVSFRKYWSGLKPILFILLFVFLYHAVLTEGSLIWSWGWLQMTREGLEGGVRFVWRIVLLLILASMLTLTTKPLVLAQGLGKLLSPLSKLRVPVEQFSLMIVIAIRFIPTIVQELERIQLAQRARGLDVQSLPFIKRMFAYVPMMIPLLLTMLQRAEQLTNAIDARAYGNGKGRTSYRELRFQRIDGLAGAVTAALFLIMVI